MGMGLKDELPPKERMHIGYKYNITPEGIKCKKAGVQYAAETSGMSRGNINSLKA